MYAMWGKVKKYAGEGWQIAVCLLLLWGVTAGGDLARQGVLRGLATCYKVLIPSLFPFMIVAGLVMNTPMSRVISWLLRPLSRWVLRVSPQGGSVFAMSMIGGFPVGAKLVRAGYDGGQLPGDEARRLALYCIGAGPAFVVTGVGMGMFGSAAVGGLYYLCCVLSALILGALLSRLPGRRRGPAVAPARAVVKAKDFPPFSAALVTAVSTAVTSMLSICGYVIAFSALLELVRRWLPLPAHLTTLLSGLLEVTTGCAAASGLPGKLGLCAAAFFLGCTGLSVVCQVLFCLGDLADMGRLLLCRLLSGVLTLGLFLLLYGLLPSESADVWQNVAIPLKTAHNSPATALLLVLFCLCALWKFCRPHTALRR